MAYKQNFGSRVGRTGEELAANFLLKAGHVILARNWRSGHLELDIVTMADDGIHFVEVKSRVFPTEAAPEESVGREKRRRLVAAASGWLKKNGKEDMEYSFDIVSVVFRDGTYDISYFPQAFIPVFL